MKSLEEFSLEGMGIDMVNVPCKVIFTYLCYLKNLFKVIFTGEIRPLFMLKNNKADVFIHKTTEGVKLFKV